MSAQQNKRTVIPWTTEEDEKLVLNLAGELEKGASLKQASVYVSTQIPGRTPEGICFRWYGILSKNETYKQLVEEAKTKGTDKKYEKLEKVSNVNLQEPVVIGLQDVQADPVEEKVSFKEIAKPNIKKFNSKDLQRVKAFIDNVGDVVDENRSLKEENRELKKQLADITKKMSELESDNKMYAGIFDKARKLAVNEETGDHTAAKPRFKMDANGNLERY